MRIKRPLPLIVVVLLVAAAIVFIVQLRKRAPPEPARLLPSGDAFFYLNLRWARAFKAIDQLPPVSPEPEYQRFIQETGFQFERDLNEAALAVHYADREGNRSKETRFSEVFVGKFATDRVTNYLRTHAASVDKYGATDIFSIPLEGRTLRVALLAVDTVAVSNHDDAATIRGIIDRSRKLASPFGGPWFMRRYYRTIPVNYEIPFTTLAWGIARIEPDSDVPLSGFRSWSMLFSKPAVLVFSARYLGALDLRAEAFTGSPEDARDVTERISTFLSLFHAAQSSVDVHGTDIDVKSFLDSIQIEQNSDRAVLKAKVTPGFLHKMLAAPTSQPAETVAPSKPAEKPPPKPKPKTRQK